MSTPWMQHVQAYRGKHGNPPMRSAMRQASRTYRNKGKQSKQKVDFDNASAWELRKISAGVLGRSDTAPLFVLATKVRPHTVVPIGLVPVKDKFTKATVYEQESKSETFYCVHVIHVRGLGWDLWQPFRHRDGAMRARLVPNESLFGRFSKNEPSSVDEDQKRSILKTASTLFEQGLNDGKKPKKRKIRSGSDDETDLRDEKYISASDPRSPINRLDSWLNSLKQKRLLSGS